MTTIAKPFVKWAGGKAQLLTSIEKRLPEKLFNSSDITYVEPFVGGGAMLFWVLRGGIPGVKRAIVNDINLELMNVYTTVRDRVFELTDMLSDMQKTYRTLSSEGARCRYYFANRDRYNVNVLSNTEKAALFIFLNRTCFNGLCRVNKKGMFNVSFGKYESPIICDENTLLADSNALQKVEILTGDFEQTASYASENTFYYLDPPYKPLSKTSSFNSYARERFDDTDQIRLKQFCDTLTDNGSTWLLSNSSAKSDDSEDRFFFSDLYSSCKIDRVLASRSINSNPEKRGAVTELLISNY